MVVFVFTAEDFNGFVRFIVTSFCVVPTGHALPAVHARLPGRFVVVIASAADPVKAAVHVRCTWIDVK
jgi:hypothetical protein